MDIILNDKKIAEARAKIDKSELLAALDLFANHGFSAPRISKIKVGEVYDGKNIKDEIFINNQKKPVKITSGLNNTLTAYINNLIENKHSIEANAFLFPGYNGQKRLKRHVEDYTDYDDLYNLKRKARKDFKEKLIAGIPRDKRISQIAATLGISTRTARKVLGIPTDRREPKPKKEVNEIYNLLKSNVPSEPDPWRFVKICDDIVVLPEIIALDEESVKKLITISFDIIKSTKTDGKKAFSNEAPIKYPFIRDLRDRVKEIEKDLIEKKGEGEENKTLEEKPAKSPNEEMVNKEIEELFADIQRVKKEVPSEKWQQWEDREASMKALLLKKEQDDENKKEADIEERLNKQYIRSQYQDTTSDEKRKRSKYVRKKALFNGSDTEYLSPLVEKKLRKKYDEEMAQLNASTENSPLLRKKLEEKYAKKLAKYNALKFPIRVRSKDILKRAAEIYNHEVADNNPDYSNILKNIIKLIMSTPFYGDEVTELRIKNVIKAEYCELLKNGNINIDWIVDKITPLDMEYPKGCNPSSIPLSSGAKEVIRGEIEFLRNIDKKFLRYFTVNTFLFPLNFFPAPYSSKPKAGVPKQDRWKLNVPELPKQSKISPQQKRMDRLKKQLQSMKGISQYCAELMKEGMPIQDVIQLVQRFARYSNKKYAERIINKIQTHSAQ